MLLVVTGTLPPLIRVFPPRTGEPGCTYSKESRLLGVDWGQADLGVDVEVAVLATGGPDGCLNAELVRLEVVVVVGTGEGQG